MGGWHRMMLLLPSSDRQSRGSTVLGAMPHISPSDAPRGWRRYRHAVVQGGAQSVGWAAGPAVEVVHLVAVVLTRLRGVVGLGLGLGLGLGKV